MKQARAILWAQWHSMRRFAFRGGFAWTAIVGAIWYLFWAVASVATARLVADPENLGVIRIALPGALLLIFLYWQLVPLLMAATGASLDLRKLQVYPIPPSHLFGIEVMLRVTSGIEMTLLLLGVSAGLVLNPSYPKWCALAPLAYIVFNLFLAVGFRDLIQRILARRHLREVGIFILVMCAALPRLLLGRHGRLGPHVRAFFSTPSWNFWPWTAASDLAQGRHFATAAPILAAWIAAAAVFGRWQFARTLSFDKDSAGAAPDRPPARAGLFERFSGLTSTLLADPLAALVEKEIRALARSPRFRLVFLMGFTFGVVMLLPASARHNSFFGENYLTLVSVYSLLLMSEACFWNSFGFDRSAAQIYFLAPVPFSRVPIGKNLSALFFIALEIAAVTAVCALIRIPLGFARMFEAYSVAAVVTIFLLCAGNLMSIHQARGVSPVSQFRSNAAGRVQSMLVIIYPVAFVPVALAYAARWAFDSQWAFFAVLAFDAAAGLIIYRIALDSAVNSAEQRKEKMIAALSSGEGPITT